MSAVASYSPNNFPDRMEADGIVVEYSGLHEIQQGSPLVGKLSVNSVTLSRFFGGLHSPLFLFPVFSLHNEFFSQAFIMTSFIIVFGIKDSSAIG